MRIPQKRLLQFRLLSISTTFKALDRIMLACDMLWNVEVQTIETDMTLYAGWEKLE